MSITCEFNLYENGRRFQLSELAALKFQQKRDLLYRTPGYPDLPMIRRPLWEQHLDFVEIVDQSVATERLDELGKVCEIEVCGRTIKFIVTNYGFDSNNGVDPLVVKYHGVTNGPGLEDGELDAVNFDPDGMLSSGV